MPAKFIYDVDVDEMMVTVVIMMILVMMTMIVMMKVKTMRKLMVDLSGGDADWWEEGNVCCVARLFERNKPRGELGPLVVHMMLMGIKGGGDRD